MAAASHHAVNRDVALVSRQTLGGAYVLLTFEHPEVSRQARAGQFVMLKAGLSADPPLRRPFSIMSTDLRAGTFTVFLKMVGPGSRALADLEPDGLAQCLGPLGRGFTPPPCGQDAVLVAGGYGTNDFLHPARSCMIRPGGRGRPPAR